MWLKKNLAGPKNEDEVISALVMPLAGHTDDEVIQFLTGQSAEVNPLAKGFIAVKAPRRVLNRVETMARVEPKTMKQMHYEDKGEKPR